MPVAGAALPPTPLAATSAGSPASSTSVPPITAPLAAAPVTAAPTSTAPVAAATAATAAAAEGTRPTTVHPDGTDLGEGDAWAWEAEAEFGELDDSDGAAGRPTTNGTGPMRIIHDMRLSDTLEAGDDEPPVPLGSGGGALGRDQSKIALLVVALLVVVAAVIGFTNLARGGSTASSAPPSTPAVTSAAAKPSVAPTTAPPSPTPSAAPSSDIAITNAQAWDPQGDGQEGNASAPRAYDGNPATAWQSQSYASANFGGYAKSGIGLVLDLGQETEVHRVMTTLRGGADFTVYLANRLSLDGATSIGSSSGQNGDVTLNASGAGAKGTLVIIWFTKLAPDGAGMFSAQVAEVKVS